MATKHFCDDCDKELNWENLISFHTFGKQPLRDKEICYNCFRTHWKPNKEKFSLNQTYVDKNRSSKN